MTYPTLVYRDNPSRRRIRRIVDSCCAAFALVAVSPVIAIAGLAIVLEDGFPVIFSQQRVGRFERLFVIYKLRTMRKIDCIDRPTPRSGADPRITRVGRWLRRTSVDELPQLFNVVRGDMSLVGPRPEMPIMTRHYEKWQNLRHLVRPGLTCIWQTTSRASIPLELPEATALDLAYIRDASIGLDGALLARTLATLLSSKGAF